MFIACNFSTSRLCLVSVSFLEFLDSWFFEKFQKTISVEYETEKQAQESIQFVNGVRIFGQKVSVEICFYEFRKKFKYYI